MGISSFSIIASVLFFTMYFSSCHGKPQYWNTTTHERCQPLKGSPNEKTDCPTNMIVVKVPNSPGDVMCDCPPYTIYFPDTNSCHDVYKRGPCSEQHYVHIGFDETEPSCVKNPCEEEGQVLFNGSCHKLGDAQPCPERHYLNVGLNDFQLDCYSYQGQRQDALNNLDYYCARGSLRVKCGMCRRIVG